MLAVALAGLAVGGYFWIRSSPLTAIRHVRVTGLGGPDASQINAALTTAAHGMSTLNVNSAALHNAVAAYPQVESVRISTSFPHSATIRVVESTPVAIVAAGGHRTAVSGDGTLLADEHPIGSLPTITLAVAPGGTRLTGAPRHQAELLAAAPSALLPRIDSASWDPNGGLEIVMRDGPKLYFGGVHQLAAKWRAAIAVLAAPSSAGAGYIDVSDPSRPAAGPG